MSDLLQEFAEKKCLLRKFVRALVAGKEIDQFVTKNRGAAGLKHDYGYAASDLGREDIENLLQHALGAFEHAKVIERTPAAQELRGESHPKSGCFQDVDGGGGGLWVEVVVECVGPQCDLTLSGRTKLGTFHRPTTKPVEERLPRENRDFPLARHARNEFRDVARQWGLRYEIH